MNIERRMTKDPVTAYPEMTIQEADNLMKKEKVHRLPVLDKSGKLIGVISEKDILKAAPSPASTLSTYETKYLLSKLTVKKIMSRNPITITKDTSVEEAATLMVDKDLSCLPVLEDDKLVGIVSKSDLFKMLLESFGARTHGATLSCLLEDKKGIVASITNDIYKKGLSLVSLLVLDGTKEDNKLVTIKVSSCTCSELISIVKPYAMEIMDVKEV